MQVAASSHAMVESDRGPSAARLDIPSMHANGIASLA